MMPSGVQELREEPRLRDAAAQQDGTLPCPPPPLPQGLPLLASILLPAVPQGAGAGALQAQGWARGLRAGLALGLLLPTLRGPRV